MALLLSSVSRWRDWAARLGFLCLAGGAAGLIWAGGRVSPGGAVGLVLLLCLAAALLLRAGGFGVLGPVFFHELATAARRGRCFLGRGLFALLLFGLLLLVYRTSVAGLVHGAVPAEATNLFVQNFFLLLLGVEFVAAVLLTPIYTAAAIAGEKERGTLEFLLATDLQDHEIVLGKLASRVAQLLLLLLVGLPVLSLLQLLGGVDPNLLIGGCAVLLGTVLGLAALGVLVSVYARRARAAVVGTYLAALAYLAGSGLAYVVVIHLLPSKLDLKGLPGVVLVPTTPPVTVATLVDVLNSGNPATLGSQLFAALSAGQSLSQCLPWLLGRYVLFQALAVVVCLGWASARLRVRATRSRRSDGAGTESPRRRRAPASPDRFALAPPRRVPVPSWPGRRQPGNRPMLWKELTTGQRTWRRSLVRVFVALLALTALALPVALVVEAFLSGGRPSDSGFREALVVLTLACACWTLLAVLVRAAGSVSGEREQQTLDSLLTTPLEAKALLGAKWLGSIFGSRWVWLWLVVLWAEGVGGGIADLDALPQVLLIWLVYAALFASLGLWFSVRCRTGLRALCGALLAAACLSFGHWLLWVVYLPFLLMTPEPAEAAGRLMRLHTAATPPAVLAWPLLPRPETGHVPKDFAALYLGPTPATQFVPSASRNDLDLIQQLERYMVLGLLACVAAAYVCWRRTLARFRQQTGRGVARQPEFAAGAALDEAEVRAYLHRARRRAVWRTRGLAAAMVLVPLAVPFAIYSYLEALADRELRQAVAEIEATDPRWRLEEIEADRPSPPEDRNGAVRVVRAKRLLPGGWGSVRYPNGKSVWVQDILGETPREVQLDAFQIRWLRAEMQRAAATLAEARALAELPQGKFPIDWQAASPMTLPLNHIQDVRSLANLLWFDAIVRAQEGDIDGAMLSSRAILNGSRTLRGEPTLISLLVRVAVRHIAHATLERVMAQGEPSEAALAAYQSELERELADPVLRAAMRGERAFNHAAMLWMEKDGGISATPGFGMPVPGVPGFRRVSTAANKYTHAWSLRFLTRAVAIAGRPAHERAEAMRQLEQDAKEMPHLARLLAPAIGKVAEAERRIDAQTRCAVVALAAERYRKAFGRWPGTLGELLPRFLAEVPLDPYDGRPVRSRRLEDRFIIYCVGPDGRDDGGNITRNPIEAGSDLGFRLWDVNRRRQLPRNPDVGPPLSGAYEVGPAPPPGRK